MYKSESKADKDYKFIRDWLRFRFSKVSALESRSTPKRSRSPSKFRVDEKTSFLRNVQYTGAYNTTGNKNIIYSGLLI